MAPGFVPESGQIITIIDNRFAGPVEGCFPKLPEGSTFFAGATGFRISYLGGDGNDVTLTVVPEPGALGLLAAGGLLLPRRRRRG